ncbi:MAG: TfoX/Sxy family protein [Minwuia sp.]|uniref:TfoX/Sxy family protein n=1 Tax=Minwuia sp. TaxID=2493630 RepID=UPI003A848A01
MPVSRNFVEHLLELLESIGAVEDRRMFGGVGLFHTNLMFAIVVNDVVYMKVDDHNRGEFEALGQGPFSYGTRDGERTIPGLYELPSDALDDGEAFCGWARPSIEAAWRADAKKPPSKRKRA